MAFPEDPLDIKVELRYDDQWNDITSYVYGRNDISIKRGRTDSNYALDPSTCTLTLNNRDGRFSNRNPSSPLYGKAGRNTPLRVSLPAFDDQAGEVLNTNPYFETNDDDWEGFDATVDQSTDFAHSGTGSLKVTPTENGGASAGQTFASGTSGSSGEVFRVSGWLYTPSTWASGVQVGIAFFNSGGTLISANYMTAEVITEDTWTYLVHTATAPANTAVVAPRVRINGSPQDTDLMYADEIELRTNDEFSYLWVSGSPGAYFTSDKDGVEEIYNAAASAPDASALGITGDIDVRFDGDIWWYADRQTLCSKYASTSDERSWILSTTNKGHLRFEWTTDGTTGTRISINSTDPVSITKGRLAVRATLDVNNGAAGNTVTFYTSDTIAGSWTQLGSAVVTSGTTSIFSSSAPVDVAGSYARQLYQPRGRIYGFRMLNGIGGTAVANPDFTSQTADAASFADTASSPNTWTIGNQSRIDDRDYRFHGEVSSWPQKWDTSGNDVYVELQAHGILRRLRHNERALKSAMYRATTADPDVVAYWPMEDGDGASFLASPIAGCPPMSFSRGANTRPDLSAFDEFDGSEPVPSFKDTYFSASIPPYGLASGTSNEVRFLFNNDNDPTNERIVTVRTTGTAREWRIFYTTGGNVDIYAFDEDGTQILADTSNAADIDNRPVRLGLRFGQDGSDVDYYFFIADAESGDWVYFNGTISSQTAGIVTEVNFNPGGGLGADSSSAALGHVAVFKDQTLTVDDSTDVYQTRVVSAPPHGWKAEHSGRRFQRLCTEQNVPFSVFGAAWHTLSMTAQRPEPLSQLLAECADADEGLLVEPRDAFELAMRTRDTMVNPDAALTLDYSSAELSGAFEPVEDDDKSLNDITAKSTNGSLDRAVLEKGNLSVQDPPDGIGRYETEITRNAEFAENMTNYANWALRLGTLDAPRYPSVSIDLARSAVSSLADDAKAVELGDKIVVENLPDWLPPDDVTLRVEGINETLNTYTHYITYDCSPGEPYEFAIVGTDRYDSDHTYLRGPMDSDDTALELVVRKGPLWDTSGGYDINVGGERMTVSAASGTASWGVDARATFGNVSSSTWDPSDTGQDWSSSGTGTWSQDGTRGKVAVTNVNSAVYALLLQPHTDIDMRFRFAMEKVPTGASILCSALARYTSTSNFYEARAVVTTAGAVNLSIEKDVAGAFSTVVASASTGVTMTAGSYAWIRFRVQGTSLKAKVWADGDDEPATWSHSGTDASLSTGTHIAIRNFLFTSYSAGTPGNFFIKDLDAAVPQGMTVTRSVNGVVKSQEKDQPLHLYERPYRQWNRYDFFTDVVDWFTGEVLGNLRSPRTVSAESGIDILNISNSTAASLSSAEVGVRFMAPLSGRVLVTTGGAARDNTNNNRAYFVPDIWLVKDSDNTWFNFLDGTAANAGFQYGWVTSGKSTDVESDTVTTLVTGLEPGRVYYARVLNHADQLTSSSTDIFYRQILVEPAP